MQKFEFDFDTVLDEAPQLEGYERVGSEFTLRELVFRHYRQYFTHDKACELCDKYVDQLCKQLNKE